MKRSLISTLVPMLAIVLFLGGRYFYFQPKYIQGEKAPAFTANLQDGTSFSLSDLKGSYVLLDFWGSWCGPCRAQSPAWVAIHRQYGPLEIPGSDGFVIVSIGIEKNEESWKNAILQDGLAWKYHILDQAESLRFFNSPIAQLYRVKQVPTSFLLNPKGEIIAADPGPAEVAKILDRIRTKN